MIWPHHRMVEILVKSVDPGVVKNGPLGDGDQLWCGPIFWPQCIGPKMGPRGSPPRFGPITVGSKFWSNRLTPGSSKMGLWMMVTNYGGDPLFGPNGAPLTPRFGPITVGSKFWSNEWVPTVIGHHHPKAHFSKSTGFVNNGSLGDGDQLWWEPIFLSQWGPIGPKMGPRGSPP